MTLAPRESRARRGLRAAFVATLLIGMATLVGCHRTPDEQQVRTAIASGVAAARANDVHGLLDVVADDFVGNDKEIDRRGLRQLLALRALRQDQTGVLTGPITLTRRGDRIVAKFNLVLTGGRAGDLLPERSAIYALTTAWKRDGGRWKCYSATWSR